MTAPGSREHGLELLPPAQLDDAPSRRPEPRGELAAAGIRRDPVEALAVQVDDPQEVAELRHQLLAERLPDVPLVQLGVPDHGDDAPGTLHAEVVLDVARGEGAERRRDGAEPHRARRQLDDLGILPPARICLEAAEHPEALEIGLGEPPAKVLDRIEHGRSMGLDRDHVVRSQRGEVECGHQGHDGGRRGLVAADLGAVGVRAPLVGVVHHVGAEPQHPPLDRLQNGQILRRDAHARARRAPVARRDAPSDSMRSDCRIRGREVLLAGVAAQSCMIPYRGGGAGRRASSSAPRLNRARRGR